MNSKKQYQFSAILYTTVLIYLSLRPIPPEIGNIFSYQDKFMHLGAYTILGILYLKIFSNWRISIVMAIGLGILLEIAQSFTSYRSFELLDIVANSCGVLIALGFYKKLLT